jgi:hypothetical protein
MGEQRGALRGEPLFGAGRGLRGWRARPAFGQLGLRGCQALAGFLPTTTLDKTTILLSPFAPSRLISEFSSFTSPILDTSQVAITVVYRYRRGANVRGSW